MKNLIPFLAAASAVAMLSAPASTANAAQPRLDLTPEQISFDDQNLTNQPLRFETRPAVIAGDPRAPGPGNGEPANIRFSFREDTISPYVSPLQRQLLVYSVADYESLLKSENVGADLNPITQLTALLNTRPATVSMSTTLPVLPQFPSNQVFHSQVKYVDFAGGAGVRFITRYAQDVSPITSSSVFYTFQGLTSDGQYYISLFYPVKTSALPARANVSGAAYDTFAKTYDAYLASTVAKLDALPTTRFAPDLARLDKLVASIQFAAKAGNTTAATGPTKVIKLVPDVPSQTQSGECFSGSIATNRADAWRCSVGNRIYDPCLTAADGKTLVCGIDPTKTGTGFKLNVSQPLPAPNKADLPQHPWLIQLTDGAICNFATGGSGQVAGQRMNYYCSDKSVLVGDLKTGDVWTGVQAVETNGSFGALKSVPIATVWE